LTKGQYSPTTRRGAVTKSSPFGTIEDPFRPAELTFGARGTFFARTLDVDLKTSQECMLAAARHTGAAVVEILVNCVIFNNGAHGWIAEKENRADRTITLRDGEKMIFGKNRDKGLVLEGFNLKTVTLGKDGICEKDILVHNAKEEDATLHLKLALMEGPEMPIAMGVIRDVPHPAYDREMEAKKEEEKSTKIRHFDDLMASVEQWEM